MAQKQNDSLNLLKSITTSNIERISKYKNVARRLKDMGFERVFSDNIANASGVSASQVRKDFSMFGITGNRRGGYQIDDLINQIHHILGKDTKQKLVVVGTGHIGKALLHFTELEKSGLYVVAGFDIDPSKINTENNPPIYPLSEFIDYVRQHNIELAVLAVPDFAAQQVFDIMVNAGIKGIVNFAPIRLRNDKDIVIKSINFEAEVETLVYFVNANKNSEK